MGLREKAAQYRWGTVTFDLSHLEEQLADKVLSKNDIYSLKKTIQEQIDAAHGLLDRKVIDLQTLLEISREIHSTLKLSDVLEIIIFTFMGHFQISDVAIMNLSDTLAQVLGKRGFSELESLDLPVSLLDYLKQEQNRHSFIDLDEFELIASQMKNIPYSSAFPLNGKEGVFGLILLGPSMDNVALTESDQDFCMTLGSLAGAALENASLYEQLDRRYNEMSALYEISRIINSSSDTEQIISLMMETLSTGFGITEAILLTADQENLFKVEEGIHIDRQLIGLQIRPDAIIQNLLQNHEADYILPSEDFFQPLRFRKQCLAAPLYSADTLVGLLLIFSSDTYSISARNPELKNLFSIIAAQLAPPLLLSRVLASQASRISDPYHPLVEKIMETSSHALQYDTDITYSMLTIRNAREYLKAAGYQPGCQFLDQLVQDLTALLPANGQIIRFSLQKVLLILPALNSMDYDSFTESVNQLFSQFKTGSDILLKPELIKTVFPQDTNDPFSILAFLE